LSALSVLALVLACLGSSAQPAAAAPGDILTDVATPEGEIWGRGIAKGIAFDGHYLFYTDYMGSLIHRIDVPAVGSFGGVTGHIDIPIIGAPSGIMTLSYDAGRDLFWAVGGDGLSIYRLTKDGMATLVFTVNPSSDRPGNCGWMPCSQEVKINYDRADDTIWYAPDATQRIYHYSTAPSALGGAVTVSATPYVDLTVAPNDMLAECGYSQSSGVAVGGADLFITVAGCPYYFEYSKTGTKVRAVPVTSASSGDWECDNLSYSVSVLWARDGWGGHIRAYEQPSATACVYGGGPAPAPAPGGLLGLPPVVAPAAPRLPLGFP